MFFIIFSFSRQYRFPVLFYFSLAVFQYFLLYSSLFYFILIHLFSYSAIFCLRMKGRGRDGKFGRKFRGIKGYLNEATINFIEAFCEIRVKQQVVNKYNLSSSASSLPVCMHMYKVIAALFILLTPLRIYTICILFVPILKF